MANIATLFVRISARGAVLGAQKFKAATRSMGVATKGLGKSLLSLKGIAIGTFGVLISASVARKFVRAVTQQEDAIAQLEAGLKSTNFQAGQTVASIRKVSAEMQQMTRFSNEAIEEIAGVGLSFTEIKDDIFPDFLRISADVATRMGADLQATALQLAKALNAPVQNLSALSRSGIQFSKSQRSVIKSLWETGQQAEAQRLILVELNRQYGGSATAAKDTLGGALDTLKNSMDDLVKTIANEVSPTIGSWADEMNDVVVGLDELSKRGELSGLTGFALVFSGINEEVRALKTELVFEGGKFVMVSPEDARRLREARLEAEKLAAARAKSNRQSMPVLLDASRAGADAIQELIDKEKEQQMVGSMTALQQETRKKLLEAETTAYIKLEEELKALNVDQKEFNQLYNIGSDAIERQLGKLGDQIELAHKFKEKMKEYREVKAVFDSVSRSIASNFTEMILGAKSAGEAFKDLTGQIIRMLIQRAIVQSLSGFGPAVPAQVVGTGAKGLVAMANGGVTKGPTPALIGEAGPEAVIPLSRDERGNLGIGGGGVTNETNLTFVGDARGMMEQMMDPRAVQRMNEVYKQGYSL